MLPLLDAYQREALLPSTLENLVAPMRMWAISLRVGALWFSWMIALFRSLGVKAYSQLAVCLLWVCQAADPWCGLSLLGDDSLSDHLC